MAPVSKAALKQVSKGKGAIAPAARRRRHRKSDHSSFKSYVAKALAAVDCSDMTITGKARIAADRLLRSFLEDAVEATAEIMAHLQQKNAGAKAITAAVRILAPGPLATKMLQAGTMATGHYRESLEHVAGAPAAKRVRPE